MPWRMRYTVIITTICYVAIWSRMPHSDMGSRALLQYGLPWTTYQRQRQETIQNVVLMYWRQSLPGWLRVAWDPLDTNWPFLYCTHRPNARQYVFPNKYSNICLLPGVWHTMNITIIGVRVRHKLLRRWYFVGACHRSPGSINDCIRMRESSCLDADFGRKVPRRT